VMLHHRETVNPTKKQLNEAGNMGRWSYEEAIT
jgi:hypothetical protein